jgi:hypothetical protein
LDFTEKNILDELDFAFNGIPSNYFPKGRTEDIQYNFFLDLEHGYCHTASSRIHLYADKNRWAIVFEKSGFKNRASSSSIELTYIGNCIDYPIDEYVERNYLTNSCDVILIDFEEYDRIENKNEENEQATFELISNETKEIKVREIFVQFDNDFRNYAKLGIEISDYRNPHKLISFDNIIRYLHETNPNIISATETEIKQHIPSDLEKLMVINEFHFTSFYEKDIQPSQQEIYQLIAKVLTTQKIDYWQPTLESNNHWSNWESGNL